MKKLPKLLLLVLLLAPLITVDCFDEARAKPYFTQLEERIAAGKAPDVGFIDELRLPFYAAKGIAQALPSELVDKDFYPQLLQQFQVTDPTRGVLTYALPQSFSTAALMVNFTAIDKAGEKIPEIWAPIAQDGKFIKTPQATDFVQTAQDVQDYQHKIGNNDFYALGLTPELGNWLPFFFQAGGKLYEKPGVLGLYSTAGQTALNLWVGLMNRKLVDTSQVSQAGWPYDVQNRLLDRFMQGKIGMMLVGGSHFDLVLNKKPGFDVRVAELPAGPARKATLSYVRGYALYQAKPAAGATALLKTLTSADTMQNTWMSNPMYIPPRPSLRSAWESKYPEHRAFMTGIDYTQPVNLPAVAWANLEKFDRAAADVLYNAMIGKISVDDALMQIDKLAADILK